MTGDGSHEGVELPTLDPGVTLLDVDSTLGIEPLCAVVLDRLLETGGHGFWVDARNHVQTRTLLRLAPHPRYLDRLTVARGFTAYQHAALLDRLLRLVSNVSLDRENPAIVVAPAMDHFYRADDIPRDQARDLLVHRLATLAGIVRDKDIPVLLTRTREDELSDPLAAAAHEELTCQATQFGPRFINGEGDDETLVYHTGDGWRQTTLAFWQEILEHRARVSGAAIAKPDQPAVDDPGPTTPASPTTPEGW